MSLELIRSFFLWCTLINYGVLVLWVVVFLFAREFFHWWIGKWARMSSDQIDLFNLAGITIYKLGIFLFNLAPCIALYVIG